MKLETSENSDSRMNPAARTSTYVFLLHLRSSENAKNVEGEREREREIDETPSTIGPRRLPGDHCMSPRVLFPEHRLLGFLLLCATLVGGRFGPFLFGLPPFLLREVEVGGTDRANSKSPVA